MGGVRRSALISLSNLSDDRMRDAKSGQWWEQNGQRHLQITLRVIQEKPDMGIFMKSGKHYTILNLVKEEYSVGTLHRNNAKMVEETQTILWNKPLFRDYFKR